MRLVIALLVAIVGSACTSQAWCSKEQECDQKDNPGTDFVAVCAAQNDGDVNAMRQNKEPECHDLADAFVQRQSCEAQLSCSDFSALDGGDNGKCKDERVAVLHACQAINATHVDCQGLLGLACIGA